MGCWGDGLCQGDADLDMIWEIENECGIKFSPTGVSSDDEEISFEEEHAQIKANFEKHLDDVVKRYSENVAKRKRSPEYVTWGYGIMLLIHTAMEHDVDISDEVRAIGRKRLGSLRGFKRKQMKENLDKYQPGELMPARSKGLDETAMDRFEESEAAKLVASAASNRSSKAAQQSATTSSKDDSKTGQEDETTCQA